MADKPTTQADDLCCGADAAKKGPAPYSNPYVVGAALGLVLLAAFVIMGRGLGSSGALSSVVACTVAKVAPAHAESNAFYAGYLEGGNPLKSYLVFQVLGVFVGGVLSGGLARRITRTVEKGPRISTGGRLTFALIGGALMGFGAKLGLGCTSGQALTGGALLNLGSWVFMMCIFAGAYALAFFMRKQWI